jgi:hypothetical protein
MKIAQARSAKAPITNRARPDARDACGNDGESGAARLFLAWKDKFISLSICGGMPQPRIIWGKFPDT